MPSVRVPYRGVDEWTRIGHPARRRRRSSALAALLAVRPARAAARSATRSPRRSRSRRSTSCPVDAARRAEHPFLDGALFALLLGAFLWLERVARRTAPLAAARRRGGDRSPASSLAPAASTATRPLLDYEAIAQSLERGGERRASTGTTTTAPLDWPRDGREVLRIRARDRAYWKADDPRDVRRHALAAGRRAAGASGLDERLRRDAPRLVAGAARDVPRADARAVRRGRHDARHRRARRARRSQAGARHLRRPRDRPLRRGNAYLALVYTPRPSAARAARGGDALPLPVGDRRQRPHRRSACRRRRAAGVGPTTARRRSRPWGDGEPDAAADARARSPSSPYARRLRRSPAACAPARPTPYDYVRAVERHLAQRLHLHRDAAPQRRPARRTSCFASTRGYCQQFSGAMALLLRMGGVPARVAAGFTPGTLDRDRREYVVRDLDAHSWVEVYFPGIGWVTFDPTPGDAPARSQTADVARTGPGAATPLRDAGAGSAPRRTARPDGGGAAAPDARQDGSSLPVVAALAARRRARGARARRSPSRRRRAPARRRRRRRRPARRAAARAAPQRPPAEPADDARGARRGAGAARRAEGYVRALRAARYGYGDGAPDARPARARCAASSAAGLRACAAALRALVGAAARAVPRRAAPAASPTRPCRSARVVSSEDGLDDAYDLFQNGMRLLEDRDYHAATVPARPRARPRARQDLDPRGARPRAVRLRSATREAAAEFEAVVERAPTNDYALFCLGRSLQQLGRHTEARKPLALACCLRPERADYRLYRDRAARTAPDAAAAERGACDARAGRARSSCSCSSPPRRAAAPAGASRRARRRERRGPDLPRRRRRGQPPRRRLRRRAWSFADHGRERADAAARLVDRSGALHAAVRRVAGAACRARLPRARHDRRPRRVARAPADSAGTVVELDGGSGADVLSVRRAGGVLGGPGDDRLQRAALDGGARRRTGCDVRRAGAREPSRRARAAPGEDARGSPAGRPRGRRSASTSTSARAADRGCGSRARSAARVATDALRLIVSARARDASPRGVRAIVGRRRAAGGRRAPAAPQLVGARVSAGCGAPRARRRVTRRADRAARAASCAAPARDRGSRVDDRARATRRGGRRASPGACSACAAEDP